jgi:hypothetical protein
MKSEVPHIETQADLLRAITALEQSREDAVIALEDRAHDLIESMRPVNVLRKALRDITESEDVKQRLLAMGVGIAAGHLARFLYQGKSESPVKEMIGSMLQVGITTYISGKPEAVQRVGGKAIRAIRLAMEHHAEHK